MGVVGGSVGFDANITDKAFVNTNIGVACSTKDPVKKEITVQGTEINATAGYKMFDNLTASVEGAYVFLGSFYTNKGTKGSDPANPYLARLVLNYVF
jgi:hypothetical protein